MRLAQDVALRVTDGRREDFTIRVRTREAGDGRRVVRIVIGVSEARTTKDDNQSDMCSH